MALQLSLIQCLLITHSLGVIEAQSWLIKRPEPALRRARRGRPAQAAGAAWRLYVGVGSAGRAEGE